MLIRSSFMVYGKAFLLLAYTQYPVPSTPTYTTATPFVQCLTDAYTPCNRPSTPIFNLLENKYGSEWIKERRIAEGDMREEVERKRLRGKVYETRATLLRRFSEPVEPPPYWKMKRWEKVSVVTIGLRYKRKSYFIVCLPPPPDTTSVRVLSY